MNIFQLQLAAETRSKADLGIAMNISGTAITDTLGFLMYIYLRIKQVLMYLKKRQI